MSRPLSSKEFLISRYLSRQIEIKKERERDKEHIEIKTEIKREIERMKKGRDKEKQKERERERELAIKIPRKKEKEGERKRKNWTRARHGYTQLVRYKRSFVKLNPQSNTDFTQCNLCTVIFYYNQSQSLLNRYMKCPHPPPSPLCASMNFRSVKFLSNIYQISSQISINQFSTNRLIQ